MAFTDDAAIAKLISLNETQDSIAATAQWFLFHRKHAERAVGLWRQKLKEAKGQRRLHLLYLANELAQQSKVRKKDDFVLALAPHVADATALAFVSGSPDVQSRVERVAHVWRQRGVFDDATQDKVDQCLRDARKMAAMTAPANGNVPDVLQPVVVALKAVEKSVAPAEASLKSSNERYSKVMGAVPDSQALPALASRLLGLVQEMNIAETRVVECVTARKAYVDSLTEVLAVATKELAVDEDTLQQLRRRVTAAHVRHRKIEGDILQSLSATYNPLDAVPRPVVREMTPPLRRESTNSTHAPTTIAVPEAPTDMASYSAPQIIQSSQDMSATLFPTTPEFPVADPGPPQPMLHNSPNTTSEVPAFQDPPAMSATNGQAEPGARDPEQRESSPTQHVSKKRRREECQQHPGHDPTA